MKLEVHFGAKHLDSKAADAEPEHYPDHEVKDAAETLMKAEGIKKKKNLMVHVKKHLDEKAGQIKSIQGLKDKYKQLASQSNEGDAEDAADGGADEASEE